MEANNSLIRKKSDIETGRMSRIGSFMAANFSAKKSGCFVLPHTSVSKFGNQMPSRLTVICGNKFWKANYNAVNGTLDVVPQFIIYYGIQLFYTVQFDYYGDNVLTAKIFKANGMESTYENTETNLMVGSDADDFIRGRSKDEFEKNKTEWRFAIAGNIDNYYTLHVQIGDIDSSTPSMLLNEELTTMFNKWLRWNTCILVYCGKKWNIDVIHAGGSSYFGGGWLDFVKECNIDVGDKLMLFRHAVMGTKEMNTIIVKEREYNVNSGEVSGGDHEKSFVKIISATILRTGGLVVPFLVKEVYGSTLKTKKRLSVIGNEWNVSYDEKNGSLSDLRDMIKSFNVSANETIILKISDGDDITGRIYREDGKEIDYVARLYNLEEVQSRTWMWSQNWEYDCESMDKAEQNTSKQADVTGIASTSGLGDNSKQNQCCDIMVVDEGHGSETQFSKKLIRSHVDNRGHGVIIPRYLKPAGRDWMAGDQVTFVNNRGNWKIGIVISTARFSRDWNLFINDNNIKESNTLVFDMKEDNGEIVFTIDM